MEEFNIVYVPAEPQDICEPTPEVPCEPCPGEPLDFRLGFRYDCSHAVGFSNQCFDNCGFVTGYYSREEIK